MVQRKRICRNQKVASSIPGLAQWVKDLALLWLWWRLAATAPIGRLAQEPPYAMGAALKRQKIKKKKRHFIMTGAEQHGTWCDRQAGDKG